MAEKTYRVTAPLVLAKNEAGSNVEVYEGGLVPAGQSDEWVARHVRDGMVAETSAPDDAGGSAGDEGDDGPPARNASAEEWRAFAVSQGLDEAEAAGMSRDELRALYE